MPQQRNIFCAGMAVVEL